jgi:hypothetical protein
MLKAIILACGLAAVAANAQQWEIGAIGGYGFSSDLTIKNGSASANTGLKNGLTVGMFGGADTYNYWSGELRYLYRFSDLKLSSGGTAVDFAAHNHIINADFLAHFRPRTSRLRPFVAMGGGVKFLIGTGIESATQPLGNFAALTATHEILPVGDVGLGVKFNFHKNLRFRAEVRDYISPAPGKVIVTAPGASISGVMNDYVGVAAISYTWGEYDK